MGVTHHRVTCIDSVWTENETSRAVISKVSLASPFYVETTFFFSIRNIYATKDKGMQYVNSTLLKMGSYSTTMMCQYWDNGLIY